MREGWHIGITGTDQALELAKDEIKDDPDAEFIKDGTQWFFSCPELEALPHSLDDSEAREITRKQLHAINEKVAARLGTDLATCALGPNHSNFWRDETGNRMVALDGE